MNTPQNEAPTYLGSNYNSMPSREQKEDNLRYALDLLSLQPTLIESHPELTTLFEHLLKSFEMNGTRAARDLLEEKLERWKVASVEEKQRILGEIKMANGGITFSNILLRLGSAFDAGKVLGVIHVRFQEIFRTELVKSLRGESALLIKEELRMELPVLLSLYIDAEVQYRKTSVRLSPSIFNLGISFESALPNKARQALWNMIYAKERQSNSRFYFPFHAQNEDYVVLLEELSQNSQALVYLKDFRDEMRKLPPASSQNPGGTHPNILSSTDPGFYNFDF